MKKILVVDFNGTSSVYSHYLAKGLINKADNVKILGKKKPEFLDVFDDLNEYIGYKSGFKFLDYVLNWSWLLVSYKKYDVIIIQWLQLLKYTNLEVKLLNYLQNKTKLIYILHNLYPHNSKDKRVINRYNELYSICNNIAIHTQTLKKTILDLNPRANVLDIHHGFFFKEFRKELLIEDNRKCLMIGYISKYKGVEDALRVVKNLNNKGVHISLEIIGLATQSYLSVLTNLISKLKIKDQVTILSQEVSTQFLINKINKASMLWLPYKNISQSGVTYTSIGLGKPFVGYDVGNFKCFFGDKGVARIVEKDNIEDFSKGVLNVLQNKCLYKENIHKLSSESLWDLNKSILN